MSPRVLLLRFLRRWHARIGFTTMLFFVFLAVTGFVLNHGADLGLNARYLHTQWLIQWYGISPEIPHDSFHTGRHQIVAANGRWLLDGKVSGDGLPRPIGIAEFGDNKFVVASATSVYIYRDDGMLIDKLEDAALPGVPIEAVGSNARGITVRTAQGVFTSTDALSWRKSPHGKFDWSKPAELPAAERRSLGEALAPGISIERLLLDLHSGRFAGHYGPLVVDLLALALTVLSLSGVWLFLRPRLHHRRGH